MKLGFFLLIAVSFATPMDHQARLIESVNDLYRSSQKDLIEFTNLVSILKVLESTAPTCNKKLLNDTPDFIETGLTQFSRIDPLVTEITDIITNKVPKLDEAAKTFEERVNLSKMVSGSVDLIVKGHGLLAQSFKEIVSRGIYEENVKATKLWKEIVNLQKVFDHRFNESVELKSAQAELYKNLIQESFNSVKTDKKDTTVGASTAAGELMSNSEDSTVDKMSRIIELLEELSEEYPEQTMKLRLQTLIRLVELSRSEYIKAKEDN